MSNAEIKARKSIEEKSTKLLIETFVETGKINDVNIPIVRGWIMDELEKRDPEAFSNWLDIDEATDEDLYKFYNI